MFQAPVGIGRGHFTLRDNSEGTQKIRQAAHITLGMLLCWDTVECLSTTSLSNCTVLFSETSLQHIKERLFQRMHPGNLHVRSSPPQTKSLFTHVSSTDIGRQPQFLRANS